MAKLHEDQIGKTQKIVGYVLAILFSFLLFSCNQSTTITLETLQAYPRNPANLPTE